MRNVPWQGEIPPGPEALNPDDFVAKTQYNSDMTVVNSKIVNVGSVAQWAADKCKEFIGELTIITGKIEELETDSADFSEKITAILSTLGNHANALADLSKTTLAIDKEVSVISDTVEENTESINLLYVSLATLRDNLGTEIASVRADISAITGRMDKLEVSIEEVKAKHEADKIALQNSINGLNSAILALGNQLTLFKTEIDKEIKALQLSLISTNENISVVSENVNSLQTDYNSFKETTADDITEINRKLDIIMGFEPVEITRFTADPVNAETGSTVNVVLSWEVSGTVTAVTINGTPVEGSTTTVPGVNRDTAFTLRAVPALGSAVSKTVNVRFANNVYWGSTKNETVTKAIVKNLANTQMTDVIRRDMTLILDNEYVVYAYPKRLGTVQFEVSNFTGGFENPVTMSVDNRAGYSEDYYVYRSTRKLTGTILFKVK